MILGLDIDGVLADFNLNFIPLVIKTTGKDLYPPRPFAIPTWYYSEFYGYTKEEMTGVWEKIKTSQIYWNCLKPYVGVEDFLGTVSGIPTYFITDRAGPNVKAQTEKWLRNVGVSNPTVLISREKGTCCRVLNVTHYLDDKIENCLDVQEKSPTTKTFMLARPWNAALPGIPRVPDLSTFLEELGA